MPAAGNRDLDEVFGLVADETRLDILRALWDERAITAPLELDPVPFSALRDSVGVADSGRFHYHLDKLVPRLVEREEDGYLLTFAGAQIVGAAISGVYTETEVSMPEMAVTDCSREGCDGTIYASYDSGHVTLACDSCVESSTMAAPPILVGAHDPASNPDVFRDYTLTLLQKTFRGFCHLCSGPVESRVADAELEANRGEAAGHGAGSGSSVKVIHECQECGAPSHTAADTILAGHPAVVSLLHEAGFDYRKVFHWRQHPEIEADSRIVDTDPVRVEVTIAAGGDVVEATLDEQLDVVTYERT